MPRAPSSVMNSSPRPRANPRNATTSSNTRNGTSTNANRGAPQESQGGSGEGVLAYIRSLRPTTATPTRPVTDTPIVEPPPPPPQPRPRQPDVPGDTDTDTNNPNLPADPIQPGRGERRPDRTLIDALQPGANRKAQKYRGNTLSTVYRLPADPARAANTMQQFNGPRGQRMTLGA